MRYLIADIEVNGIRPYAREAELEPPAGPGRVVSAASARRGVAPHLLELETMTDADLAADQDLGPVLHGLVGGDQDRALLVAAAHVDNDPPPSTGELRSGGGRSPGRGVRRRHLSTGASRVR